MAINYSMYRFLEANLTSAIKKIISASMKRIYHAYQNPRFNFHEGRWADLENITFFPMESENLVRLNWFLVAGHKAFAIMVLIRLVRISRGI